MSKANHKAGFITASGKIDPVRDHNQNGGCAYRLKTDIRYRVYPIDCRLVIESLSGFTTGQIETVRQIYQANVIGVVVLWAGQLYEYDTFVNKSEAKRFFNKLQSFVLH